MERSNTLFERHPTATLKLVSTTQKTVGTGKQGKDTCRVKRLLLSFQTGLQLLKLSKKTHIFHEEFRQPMGQYQILNATLVSAGNLANISVATAKR